MPHQKFILMALIMLLASLLISCGGGGGSNAGEGDGIAVRLHGESAGDLAEGEIQFQRLCSTCHGLDAKGLPNLGKDLTTSEFLKTRTDQEFVEFIKTGRPSSHPENTTGIDMPPKGGNPALTEEQMIDIVVYVQTLEE